MRKNVVAVLCVIGLAVLSACEHATRTPATNSSAPITDTRIITYPTTAIPEFSPTPNPPPTNTLAPTPEATPPSLSTQLSFSDTYIEGLEARGAQFLESTETTVSNTRYVLFFFWDEAETLFLAYRFEGNVPILLRDSRADDLPGRWAIGSTTRMEVEPWGDLNNDGNPDVVMYYSYAGTAWGVRKQVHLWQIEPNRNLIDLTAPIYEDYRLIPQYAIEDINDDGILELWIGDYRGEFYGPGHALGVSSFKIYAWQDEQVYDVSDAFVTLYDDEIAKHREYVVNTYEMQLDEQIVEEVLTRAFGLLIAHENSGRRDEGWQTYWTLTDPEHWSYSSTKTAEIITVRRELHQVQYESGEPFRK